MDAPTMTPIYSIPPPVTSQEMVTSTEDFSNYPPFVSNQLEDYIDSSSLDSDMPPTSF